AVDEDLAEFLLRFRLVLRRNPARLAAAASGPGRTSDPGAVGTAQENGLPRSLPAAGVGGGAVVDDPEHPGARGRLDAQAARRVLAPLPRGPRKEPAEVAGRDLGPSRTVELGLGGAEQVDGLTRLPPAARGRASDVVEDAEHADDRGRVDRHAARLVVQGHIA